MKIIFQVFISLLILLIAALILSTRVEIFPVGDYVEYWAAGKIILAHGNPYSPTQILEVENSVGWTESEALMMYNPPWILPITMVMALFPYAVSRATFFLINLLIFMICADIAWKKYLGSDHKPWLPWLISLTFCGVLFVLKFGQIGAIIVLGICLFLFLVDRKLDFFAGLMVPFILLKPHIVYLFILAIIIWAFQERRWQILSGSLVGIIIFILIPVLANPLIISEYLYLTLNNPTQNWATATITTPLRILFGTQYDWIQFTPLALGLVWLIGYWIRNRKNWDWYNHSPFLLLMSLWLTAYGWTFDFPVIYLALLQAASWAVKAWPWKPMQWLAVLSYVILNIFVTLSRLSQAELWWVSTVFLLLYMYSNYIFQPNKHLLMRKR